MMSEAKIVHVLGIVGSPRRVGNTETLVDEVLRGAEEARGKTEGVFLKVVGITPARPAISVTEKAAAFTTTTWKRSLRR